MKVNTATRLKQIMSERNLKQVDIIRLTEPYQNKLGIKMGKSTLSQYINGIQNPDQDRIYLLSKSLGVSEPWLMGYDVPKDRIPDGDRNRIIHTTLTQITDTSAKLEEPRQKEVLLFAEEQLHEQQLEQALESDNITDKELELLADEVIKRFGIETLENLIKVADSKRDSHDSSNTAS